MGYALKVGGLEMIRTLFLYLKSNIVSSSDSRSNIYHFYDDRIVALDTFRYNSREQRYKLQKELAIYPYTLSPNVFKEFVIYSSNNPSHILLRSITFYDRSIEKDDEYVELNSLILDQKFDDICSIIYEIMEEFDTDINNLIFRYEGYDFKITCEGVIEVDAPEDILAKFLEDGKINKLILGVNG